MPVHDDLSYAGVCRVAVVEDAGPGGSLTQIQRVIRGIPGVRLVSSSTSLRACVAWAREAAAPDRPDLLMLDLGAERGRSPDHGLIEALVDLRIRVILLSAMAAPEVLAAMLGAQIAEVVGRSGSDRDIVSAVQAILASRQGSDSGDGATSTEALSGVRPQLSVQEERTLSLYGSGLTLTAVAGELGVAVATARTYLARLKHKYASAGRPLHTKVELAHEAVSRQSSPT